MLPEGASSSTPLQSNGKTATACGYFPDALSGTTSGVCLNTVRLNFMNFQLSWQKCFLPDMCWDLAPLSSPFLAVAPVVTILISQAQLQHFDWFRWQETSSLLAERAKNMPNVHRTETPSPGQGYHYSSSSWHYTYHHIPIWQNHRYSECVLSGKGNTQRTCQTFSFLHKHLTRRRAGNTSSCQHFYFFLGAGKASQSGLPTEAEQCSVPIKLKQSLINTFTFF